MQGDNHGISGDVRDDLDALLRTIDDTLRLARAETTMASEFASVDLAAIVREAGELFEPVAEDRQITLTITTTQATVNGVRSLLAQLVANLIDNAIKYTLTGGSVSVSLAPGKDGVILRVADSGPGIPANQRDRAKTRFVRLDNSRHADGSGLGLSIDEVVARVHGACLTLDDNQPGLLVTVGFLLHSGGTS